MALIQSATGIGGSATFASPVTAGSTIIVAYASGGTFVSLTDDHSQVYTGAGATANNSGSQTDIYYKIASVGGVTVISLTTSLGTEGSVSIYEISSSTFTAASGGHTTGTSASALSASIPNSGFYISQASSTAPESAFDTISGSWTLDFTGNFFNGIFGAAHIDAVSGVQTVTYGTTISGQWTVSTAGFTYAPSCPTLVTLTGGNFTDSLGNPLGNGTLALTLTADASIQNSCTNTILCAGLTVLIKLDNTGNVAPNQAVWGNDAMSPNTTKYRVSLFDNQGRFVWSKPQLQRVTGSSPFNVGTWIPS